MRQATPPFPSFSDSCRSNGKAIIIIGVYRYSSIINQQSAGRRVKLAANNKQKTRLQLRASSPFLARTRV